MKDLIISGVQCPLKWEDPEANREALGQRLEALPESDIVVLPEMFTTGFTMSPETVAETHSDDMATLKWMRAHARRLNAAVTGSVSVKDGDDYFNRMYWVMPDGETTWYDKQHLFTFADEHHHYSPGKRQVVVECHGWRILLQVCYDLRFPEQARNRYEADEDDRPRYDVALYVANWPGVRAAPWKTLLRARAIENQCYLVGVNRVGEDGKGIEYTGDSAIIDPKGVPLTEATPGRDQVITARCSYSELQDFREKFPVLRDSIE